MSEAGDNNGQMKTDEDDHASQVDSLRRSERSRTLTEKGLAHQIEVKNKKRQNGFIQLMNKADDIKSRLIEDVSRQSVQLLYSHWMTLYEVFLDIQDEYANLLSEEDSLIDKDTWLAPRLEQIQFFRSTIERWFERTDPVSKIETLSQHSGRSNHSSSVKSSMRSGSLAGSVLSAKLKEEQRRAELLVKADTLERKKKIEQAKLRLKLEEEELKLKSEMAIVDAKSKVVNQFETMLDSRQSATYQNRDTKQDVLADCQIHSSLKATAPVFIPNVKGTFPDAACDNFSAKSSDSSKSVEETIIAVVKHLKKPPLDIKKFDGNPMEYKRFRRQFQFKIAENCDNNDECINFLEQYTVGEPHKIVTGLSYLDSSVSYEQALKEMDERYGDVEVIVNAYIKKALTWPVIKAGNAKSLDEFSLFLQECQNAVQSLEAVRILEYSENFRKLVGKLPFHLHDKWRSIVQQTKDKGTSVKFHQLVSFVKREAKKAIDPTFGKDALVSEQKIFTDKKDSQRVKSHKSSFASNTTEGHEASQQSLVGDNKPKAKDADTSSSTKVKSSVLPATSKIPCDYCSSKHHAFDSCERFSGISFGDRIAYLKSKGLCFGCLQHGHSKMVCRNRSRCQVCQKVHPTILHIEKYSKLDQNDRSTKSDVNSLHSGDSRPAKSTQEEKIQCHMGAGCDADCTMAIIPVSLRCKNGTKTLSTYAVLDPGSNTSFCSENVARRLGVSGQKMSIKLDTMGATQMLKTQKINGLEVGSIDGGSFMELPPVYTKDSMPVSVQHIPTEGDIGQWKHLDGVTLPQINETVGLLIGNNVPDAYTPLELKTGPLGSPHGARSLLGWIVWNVIRGQQSSRSVLVNRAEVSAIQETEELQQLTQMYQRSVNLDFPEKSTDEKAELSVEDQNFLHKVTDTIKLVGGHYEMSLPFRHDDVHLPNNEVQAAKRLQSLKKKLQKNQQLKADYEDFMEKIISQGYAEVVPVPQLQRNDGRVWYIPHHAVYHPHKPNKIRVVFDCTASHQGVSLNGLLLHGPDLTSSLIGVLMKFRQERIALMSDIESMFYQVRVSSNDTDCLRFLWWPAGDPSQKPLIYRMLVHLFGATSSPSCANLALQQVSTDNNHLFQPEICKMVHNNFYVDDFLKSVSSEREALAVVHEVTKLCSKGGFRLTKWSSNSREVLDAVPLEERAKELKDVDLTKDDLPSGRALGVSWCSESDKFGFKVMKRELVPTRRSILSYASSIFDPLGLVSPFIMRVKMLLQSLCKQGLSWDEELQGSDLSKWQNWVSELEKLNEFSIPRCVKPYTFDHVATIQLHHFADASESGYGVVTYLRLVNTDDHVHCSLLFSKARVSPLKKITIPRLELSAATLAVRMHHTILKQLDYEIQEVCYWTDSMAVLRYIWNESSRFQTYVANIHTIIRDGSDVKQWRYLKSDLNPADDVSRGMKAVDLMSDRWLYGPSFLMNPVSKWPSQPDASPIAEDDPEVKCKVNAVVEQETGPIKRLLSHCSSFFKLKKMVAWLMVAKRCLMSWVHKRKTLTMELERNNVDPLTLACTVNDQMQQIKLKAMNNNKKTYALIGVQEINEAEKFICQYEQLRFFGNVIDALSNGHRSTKCNSIHKLDPIFIDGMLRVGGRIERASVPYGAKHPVILPAKSPVSQLILYDAHQTVGHLGRNSILAEVRQRFWIQRANLMIKRLLSKCVICRRYRARPLDQKMADLPQNRTEADEPPFTRVGMDFFGPLEAKRGRSLVKRYGVIFTCLSMRALYLELASSLNTYSCVNSIRQLIAQRGVPKVIMSDNGTNLVGAQKELKQEIQNWNQSQIHADLLQKGIDWQFNPPTGSHFGGSWERMIRSVRQVLYALLRQQNCRLDDEALATLFCEVEAILNARPITKMSNEVNDFDAITPNHLLLLRSGSTLPCGEFSEDDNYTQRRWRQIQHLADVFWVRWKRDYLSSLQERQKWHYPKSNVSVGDIVLLMDNTPRNSWALGKICKTYPDRKGAVRVVDVKTKSNVLRRPIHKLCRILEAE